MSIFDMLQLLFLRDDSRYYITFKNGQFRLYKKVELDLSSTYIDDVRLNLKEVKKEDFKSLLHEARIKSKIKP